MIAQQVPEADKDLQMASACVFVFHLIHCEGYLEVKDLIGNDPRCPMPLAVA